MEQQTNLSVFWIATELIDPNPYQPRKEFQDAKLKDLAQSIRRYGVLQPLVVTKKETETGGGAMETRYELIAGERRLRASKMAGLTHVPAVIRTDIDDDATRLELAVIENLQREGLNPVERARAFKQLVDEFHLTQTEIAERMSMSREYVSNSIRLLTLPEQMIQAVSDDKIAEGHTRPLLMLSDRPEEQEALFNEIINRNITVREAEHIARSQAVERARKKDVDPEIVAIESLMSSALQARVHINSRGENGGKIVIDFFSPEDLQTIAKVFREDIEKEQEKEEEVSSEEEDLYNFKNFSL